MKPIRRILVVEPYGIGDLLFVTPVLRALRLLPGVERVDLVLGSRTLDVVSANPHVDEIFVIDKDLFHRRSTFQNAAELFRLTKKLREHRYDLLLDYSQRQEYGFWGILLGIPLRAGFEYKNRGIFLNHKVSLQSGFTGQHVADFYAEVAECAGVPVRDRFFEMYLTPEQEKSGTRILVQHGVAEPFAVVAPGGGESWGKDAHFKQWPAAFFSGFAEKIHASCEVKSWVVLGSPTDKAMGDEFLKSFKFQPKVNLCGKTSIAETAAILGRAQIFVGNDGGLLHLAKAMRIPVIGFYGPVDPEVYGPYPSDPKDLVIVKEELACRPCYKKFRYESSCAHRDCLQALTVDEAVKKFESMTWVKEAK